MGGKSYEKRTGIRAYQKRRWDREEARRINKRCPRCGGFMWPKSRQCGDCSQNRVGSSKLLP